MFHRSLRRALAPLLVVGSLSGAVLALGSSPADAATTLTQSSRCEGDVPRLDLTIANDDAAPITVDVLLDGVVVEVDTVVPATAEVTVALTFAPGTSVVSVVDADTAASLATAPITAPDPGCLLPDASSSDITVSSTSPCEEEELLPRVAITNEGPIDAVVDLVIDGEVAAAGIQVPGGQTVSQALAYGEATAVQVLDTATRQVLAEGPLAPTQCPGPQAPAPAPAVPLEHAPAYTG